MRTRWFNLLVLVVWLVGLLPMPAYAASASSAPAASDVPQGGTDEEVATVERALLDKLAADGSTDFVVVMKEQADLSAAYEIEDWSERGHYVYNKLREVASRTQAPVITYAERKGVEYESFLTTNSVFVKGGTQATVEELKALPGVALIRLPKVAHIDPAGRIEGPNPLRPDAYGWNMDALDPDSNLYGMQAVQVWDQYGVRGDGVVVANIDTGVTYQHEALIRQYRGNLGGSYDHNFNWYAPTNDAAVQCGGDAANSPCDSDGHGSGTAGIMVGETEDLTEQTGAAPAAEWIACMGCDGYGPGGPGGCSEAALTGCADWFVAPCPIGADPGDPTCDPDQRPHIINNSWGGGNSDPWYRGYIQAWVASGMFPAFSAGNTTACASTGSPGDNPEAFGTAAHGTNGQNVYAGGPTWFPNPSCDPEAHEVDPHVNAPTFGRTPSEVPGSYYNLSGTSGASPHTAGAVALVWSANPGMIGEVYDTFTILEQFSNHDVPEGDCGKPACAGNNIYPNYEYGWGYLDALAAVEEAMLFGGGLGYLHGTVTNASTGDPVEDASVQATLVSHDKTWQTQTGADGYYHLTIYTGTYTVEAFKYGYQPHIETGVSVISATTKTLDIALTPATFYAVEGYVTDATTGWPLYAKIDVDGYPSDAIWTDPVTGYYSMTLAEGITYTFHVDAWVEGYDSVAREVGPLTSDVTENFALEANLATCTAPGYTPVYGYNEDFEVSDGGFTPDGTPNDWGWGMPMAWPNSCASGDMCWGTNLFGNYANNADETLTSPVIDLSGIAPGTDMTVNWWQAWHIESASWDHAYALVSFNGGPWQAMWSHEGGTTQTDWTKLSYGISDAAGGTVQFRWRFTSDGSVTYSGYFIDGISIQTGCDAGDGGLVVGHVYDENYPDEALAGAKVMNDAGEMASTSDMGFYTIYSPAGDRVFTATMQGGYGMDVETVSVVSGDTIEQDFFLPAARLRATPMGAEATLPLGYVATDTLTLENIGNLATTYELLERAGEYHPHIPAYQGNLPASTEPASAGLDLQGGKPEGRSEAPRAWPLEGKPAFVANVSTIYGDHGLGSFQSDDPAGWSVIADYSGTFFAGDFLLGDFSNLYAVNDVNQLYKIDTATSAMTLIGNSEPNGGENWSGLTGANDGTLYGVAAACGSHSTLYTIDPATGATTEIGEITNAPCLIDVAINADGEMYGVDIVNDTLVQVDPVTGVGTEIGPIGLNANYAQGMDFEEESGVLYWAAYDGGGDGNLRILDTETGNSAMVDYFPTGEFDMLAFATGGSADVPWLSEDPTSGSIAANDSEEIEVSFDAAYVDQPGTYYGDIIVKSDSPYPKFTIPVTMTVTPPNSWAKVAGTVTGTGACDNEPVLLEEAEVVIESATTGKVWTLTTDISGTYQLWLDEGHSPLTITVTAPDYEGVVTDVMLEQGETTTVDFDLRLQLPCLSYSPDGLEATLEAGNYTTDILTLYNTGAVEAEFELVEINMGFTLHQANLYFPRSDAPISVETAPAPEKAGKPLINPSIVLQSGSLAYGVDLLGDDFVSFTLDDATNLNNITAATRNYYAGDFMGGDFSILYAIDNAGPMLYAFDTTSGLQTVIGSTPPQSGHTWTGMAGDPVSRVMYAASTDGSTNALYTLDLATGTPTLVGTFGGGFVVIDIAVSSNGQMYGLDIATDSLLSIDKGTGAITSIGSIGFDASYAQGMDFDYATGDLYLAAYNNSNSSAELRLADLATGATTMVSTIGAGAGVEMDAFAVAAGSAGGAGVPWLSEDPMTGTVPADSSLPIDITFDASVPETMQPGEYHAELLVQSNAVNDVPNVPVTLTVLPADSWGKLSGTVTGMGYCDAEMNPIEEAEILIETEAGYGWTIMTDENGEYTFWLDEAHSPLTVTVMHPDYLTEVITQVNVSAGMTMTLDAALRWAQPCLSTTPDAVEAVVTLGFSTTLPLTLTNNGAMATPFNLIEIAGGFTPAQISASLADPTRVFLGDPDALSLSSDLGPVQSVPADPWAPSGDVQLVVDDGSAEDAIGLTAGGSFLWLNRFTPDPAEFPFFLDEISILFRNSATVGEEMQLLVWEDTDGDGDPGTGANLLYSTRVDVQHNDGTTWNVYNIASPILLFGPGDVLIGVVNRDGTGTHPAAIDTNASQERSWIGAYPSSPPDPPTLPAPDLWGTIDSFGFAGNWTVRGSGYSAVGLDMLPWLSEMPESGTVPADGSTVVDLTFDASDVVTQVTEPGEYYGTLRVLSDDPVNPSINVPVTMTVNPPATWGKIEGTVYSLGYCDAEMEPVPGLDVLVEGSSGMTWTVTTNVSGTYSLWLDESESPIDVTVEAPDHTKGEALGITVTAGSVVTQNFQLRLLEPCLDTDPTALHATLELNTTAAEVLTLTNSGAASTDWLMQEENLGSEMTVLPPDMSMTLLSEDFEGTFPPAGWVVTHNITTTCDWESTATAGRTNNTGGSGEAAIADSDGCGSGTEMDTLLISPVFDLSSAVDPYLAFQSDYYGAGSLDDGYVDISTDGGMNWTTLLHYVSSVRGPHSVEIPLTDYAGEPSVMVRFHYVSPGWHWWWQVDDMEVFEVDQVPWVDENPKMGTLAADGASTLVNVDFDATLVDQPGDYYANLEVYNDGPLSPIVVPVTMSVSPPATWGQVMGTITSSGHCDVNPAPLANATLLFESWSSSLPVTVTDVLLEQDFEGSFPPAGWVLTQTGSQDDPGWLQTTMRSNSGSYSVYHTDEPTSALGISWLILPQVAVPTTGNTSLNFWQNQNFAGYYNYHGIWVSTASNDPSDFVELVEVGAGIEDTWTEYSADLSAYAGQSVYLAFRYEGDFADEWFVDDVQIVHEYPDTLPVSYTTMTDDAGNYSYWLPSDTYTLTISEADHEPVQNIVTVPAGMTIVENASLRQLVPCASVTPDFLGETLEMGNTATRYITITNQGAGAYDYEIVEYAEHFIMLSKAIEPAQFDETLQQVSIGDNVLARQPNSPKGISYPEPAAPAPRPNGIQSLTHSLSQAIISGNSVACGSGGLHADNSYFRVFDLPAFGIDEYFAVQSIDMGIQTATAGSNGIQPVVVNLYTLDGPLAWENLTLIGSADAAVADQELSIINVPVTGTAPAGSTLVVEFHTPNGQPSSNGLWVGSNDLGQTGPSYLAAEACGFSQPTELAAIGFPNMHIVMNVIGFTPEPVEVPWLSEDPVTGTVMPGSSQVVTVTFDAGQVPAPDVYYATLNVKGNELNGHPVQVIMTATMPANFGHITGTVMGLGPCDDPLAAVTLPGAEVQIESATDTWTVQTDDFGFYEVYLDAVHSPVTITVTAADYLTETVSGVVLTPSVTTNQDFNLHPIAPCADVIPDAINETVSMGTAITLQLTIDNSGLEELGWSFEEKVGGFTILAPPEDVPWMSVTPDTGTTAPESTEMVTVTLDASVPEVEQPGIYTATLLFNSDDALNPTISIPVVMTVTPPADWGKLTGLVQSLGYCDNNPAPLEGARVYIQSAMTETISMTSALSETFEGEFPPAGWRTVDNLGTGNEWDRNDAFGALNRTTSVGGSGFSADADSDRGNGLAWDSELWSPLIDLQHVPTATLSFASNFQDFAGDGEAWLDITTNGGQTWDNLYYKTTDDPFGGVFHTFSLDAYAGESVHLRWRYSDNGSGDAWYWQIDNVLVNIAPFEAVVPVEWLVDTDENGEYAIWIDQMYSPLTVTISHEAGHGAQVFTDVVINGGETTTLNADLRLLVPCVTSAPDAFTLETTMGAAPEVQTLTLSNTGAMATSFNIMEWNVGLDPLGPMATGGPDKFGYTMRDSAAVLGPVYDFIDIFGVGTELSLADNEFAAVDIGFDFRFYGTSVVTPNTYNTAYVSNNGLLSFGQGSSDFSNDPAMPDPTLPNNIIASVWDDLVAGANGAIYYHSFDVCPYNPYGNTMDACLVVQYEDYELKGAGLAGTWEVILFRSGSILMQFAEANAPDATTGIENALGTDGLNYAPNLTNELAVCFAYPGQMPDCASADIPWLEVDPTQGTLATDETEMISVTFDPSVPEVQEPGDYRGEIWISTDDPNNGFITIPVTMTILQPTTQGKMWGTIYAWDYCDTMSTPMAGANIMVETSSGDVRMMQSDSNGDYALWLNSGETVTMTVSHDGHVSEMVVEQIAAGIMPAQDIELHADVPCVGLTYEESFDVIVQQGEQVTRTLTLHNRGAGELTYQQALGTSLWLSTQSETGTLEPYSSEELVVVFDATGLNSGIYESTLEILHNDPESDRLFVRPVKMTVVATDTILLPPMDAKSGDPGETVTYTLTISNQAASEVTFDVMASGNVWTTTMPSTVVVGANASEQFVVSVEIPIDAHSGYSDTATITVESQGADAQMASTVLRTTVAEQPLVVDVTKTARAAGVVEAGGLVTYTITVANNGNDPVDVVLTDTIPVNTSYVAGTVTGGATYFDPGNRIEWSGMLDKNQTVTINFAVLIATDVITGTVITNTVEVMANGTLFTDDAIVTVGETPQPPPGDNFIFLPLVMRNFGP